MSFLFVANPNKLIYELSRRLFLTDKEAPHSVLASRRRWSEVQAGMWLTRMLINKEQRQESLEHAIKKEQALQAMTALDVANMQAAFAQMARQASQPRLDDLPQADNAFKHTMDALFKRLAQASDAVASAINGIHETQKRHEAERDAFLVSQAEAINEFARERELELDTNMDDPATARETLVDIFDEGKTMVQRFELLHALFKSSEDAKDFEQHLRGFHSQLNDRQADLNQRHERELASDYGFFKRASQDFENANTAISHALSERAASRPSAEVTNQIKAYESLRDGMMNQASSIIENGPAAIDAPVNTAVGKVVKLADDEDNQQRHNRPTSRPG